MEDTHWVLQATVKDLSSTSLNPCFNGRYSLRLIGYILGLIVGVLILVLMEDTHWVKTILISGFMGMS